MAASPQTKAPSRAVPDTRAAFNAHLAVCPSRQLLDRISDRWVGQVVNALAEGSARYSELARSIVGVSQKMLTQTLRNLERDGLVKRTVTPSVPVRVDYALTSLGESLLVPISALRVWADENMGHVHDARSAYDSSQQAGSTTSDART